MLKVQKKSAALNEKMQATRKSRNQDKPSVQTVIPVNNSKQAMIIALLERRTGATIHEIAKAVGWQRHSVHGMVSGVLKKRLGLTITSGAEERGRVYRITGSVSRL
jgi:hypothetical protein